MGVIIVPRTPGEPWWPLLEESSESLASFELVDPFISATAGDSIYSSRRMTWHAHAFTFGLRVVPDQCLAFRQAGARPQTPAQLHADSVRSTFLAPALASVTPTTRPS